MYSVVKGEGVLRCCCVVMNHVVECIVREVKAEIMMLEGV